MRMESVEALWERDDKERHKLGLFFVDPSTNTGPRAFVVGMEGRGGSQKYWNNIKRIGTI